MAALPEIRNKLLQSRQNDDPSRQQIEVTKTGTGLNRSEVPRASALHVNAGLRQQIAKDFVLDADVVFKRFNHLGLGQIDANHFSSVSAGPAIRECLPEERNDPQIDCTNGPITFVAPVGRADYSGLLVRADKKFFNGSQLLASWAYSRIAGTNGGASNGFNRLRWHENRGPFDTDFTHILNLSGMTRLPARFIVGFNFSYSSAPPFSAYVGGMDFNEDGRRTDDLLPGSTVNAFNRGKGPKDLEQLVSQFNSTKAGQLDAANTAIPMLTLPAQYSFGDNFQALDLRLSRSFSPKDGMTLKLMVDVFNVYNAANLSGHSGDLTNKATFGQPTNRYSQVFGSGGPRAFQLGAKMSF